METPPPQNVTLTVRLSRERHRQLCELAAASDCNVSTVFERLIEAEDARQGMGATRLKEHFDR